MADEKPKTLQEQSSPTGPPVSQEVKDTAPAVAQPDKEKDKAADTKAVEVKETEAAGSKKLDDIVKQVKEAQQKQTEASPAAPGKKQSASITKISDLPKTGQKKAEKPEPTKKTAAPKKETMEKPVQPVKSGKSKSTAPVSKGAPCASAPAQAAPTPPEPPKEAPRRGEEQIVYLKLNELHAFKNHPFGVRDDEEMRAMVSSVKDKGVTQPAIVRPLEGGGYEIVSGHRRQKASELAGYTDMPCMLPFFFFAMYERDGLPLEKVLRNILRTRFLYPRVRPYQTENFYALLSGFKKEAKPIAEPEKKKKPRRKKA